LANAKIQQEDSVMYQNAEKNKIEEKLDKYEERMSEFDIEARKLAKKRFDNIAKPLDGLGIFEDIICDIAGITSDVNVSLSKKCVVVVCADNGIVEENISQSKSDVTYKVAKSLVKGTSSVCKMAKYVDSDSIIVDVGIENDEKIAGIIDKKIRNGSRNFSKESAMTRDEVFKAIDIGIELVENLKNAGYKIIATGEMGIGNTTTSAAVAGVLLNAESAYITGRGAGLDDDKLNHKIKVIDDARYKYFGKDNIHINDENRRYVTFKALQNLGGYDIACMVGIFLGGAIYKVPIVIDGLISLTAALCCKNMFANTEKFMLASHVGKEPATAMLLDTLGKKAVISANLALGEGTGAVMLFPLIEQALCIYNDNTDFGDIEVGNYKRYK